MVHQRKKSATKAEVFPKAIAKYGRYGDYAFIAYWFDLWKNYEKRTVRSPQWTIEQLENEQPGDVEYDHNSVFSSPT